MDQLQYYRTLINAFRETSAPTVLVDELDRVVTELERLAKRKPRGICRGARCYFEKIRGQTGRSLVFDIAFSETLETSRPSPDFPLLSPHAGCHHLSELQSNRKRLPLAEVVGYAERG